MSYTRPDHDAAAVTWVGAPEYSRPASDAATASWVELDFAAIASAPSPLGDPAALVGVSPWIVARAPSLLSVASSLVGNPLLVHVFAPSPLTAPSVRVHSNWTALVPPGAVTYYACDITGPETLRVPVSSWQATIQTGRMSYVQAVIPAATQYAQALLDRYNVGQIVIYRGARSEGLPELEIELARAPLSVMTTNKGPRRETVTVAGYGAAYDPTSETWPETSRTMTGIRSVSMFSGEYRVRCSIDWALRPGMQAHAGDIVFVVAYINYYASSGQAYMDIGSRAQ